MAGNSHYVPKYPKIAHFVRAGFLSLPGLLRSSSRLAALKSYSVAFGNKTYG